jgi:glutaredoxin
MYTRTFGCPYVSIAKRVLKQHDIPYREIFIDRDKEARDRVLAWTGFLSVPTLVVSENGGDLPIREPAPLPQGGSPRGIDRGDMITEAGAEQLTAWLQKHDFIAAASRTS